MTTGLRLVVGFTLATAVPWAAYGGPAERCRQQKNVAAGKLAACRQKAEGRYGTVGDVVRLTGVLLKCDASYERRSASAETTAAGTCPTIGDVEAIEKVTRQHTTDVAIMLAGSTPADWAHVLGRYFEHVQAMQHWYDKPGVDLNLVNSPADTVIVPSDFVFRPVAVDGLYTEPTISAVFVARTPIPAASRLRGAAGFVDDSFTRPAPAAPSWIARARGMLAL